MVKNFVALLALSFAFLMSPAHAHDIGKPHSHEVNYDEADEVDEVDDYYVIQEELFECPQFADGAPCYTNVSFPVPHYESDIDESDVAEEKSENSDG